MPEKKRLSPSTIGTLSGGCAYQIEMYDIHGPNPPGVAAVIGTAGHATVRDDLRAKIETGSLLGSEEVADNAAEQFDGAWLAKDPMMTPEEKANPTKTKGAAKDLTILCALTHHAEVAPEIDAVAVERRLDVELVGFPHDLSGYVDIQAERGPWDTKFSKKAQDAERAVQLDLYSLMLEVNDGTKPTEQVFTQINTGRKTPNAVLSRAAPPDSWDSTFQRIEIASRVLESGALMPADPTHWKCSEKWCGWFDLCAFGRRRRTQH